MVEAEALYRSAISRYEAADVGATHNRALALYSFADFLHAHDRVPESLAFIDRAVGRFAALREAAGPEVDLAIDFHGAISPQKLGVPIAANLNGPPTSVGAGSLVYGEPRQRFVEDTCNRERFAVRSR